LVFIGAILAKNNNKNVDLLKNVGFYMSVGRRLHTVNESKYNYELINLFISGIVPGIIIGNIVIPIIYLYAMQEFLPASVQTFFIFYALFVSTLRLVLLKLLKVNRRTKKSDRFINYTVIATGFSATLWGVASILTYIYAPQDLFLISAIVMGLISGAMSTMVSIFKAYIYYSLVMLGPLLVVLLLANEPQYNIFSIAMFFYAIFVFSGANKHHKKLKEVIKLKDELKLLNGDLEGEVKIRTLELEALNNSLEDKVTLEIEKNRVKDQHILEQSRMAQMGEMISMIAHQWRQPLGAIASTSIDLRMKMMLGSYDLDDKKQQEECSTYLDEQLVNIEEYVQSLTQTIDDFRNFYKPDKQQKVGDVNQPIQKSLDIIRATAVSNGIEIIESYKSKQQLPLFDSELMQVFLNIFKNAQDNFKEKDTQSAKIVIKTKDRKNGVKVEICDNGGGISKDIIKKIFDPYFSTKSEKNGTGLGLYMSKTIVEEHHNGKLKVKNRDGGACFTILINN
jgi:signal transduction histidine kinase